MINSVTHQQRVNHQAVQNHSQRGGQSSPHNFQLQHDQNNQLQQLLNILLPLLQQLISCLGNNDENNQHCNNQCDSEPPQELQLSDTDKDKLIKAVFPPGTGGTGFPPVITGSTDTNCDGKLSIGDTIEISIGTGNPEQPLSVNDVTINQEILDRYNAL